MKDGLLDRLRCPECGGALSLGRAVREAGEIREGELSCAACPRSYPVRDFIPRFVETDRYVDSFSFEWRVFRKVQIDILNRTTESEETFRAKTGYTPEQLRGRFVLDAGVGAGRFAEVVSRWGAEVVGMDLSFSVDAARLNVGERPNVHLVQADIFRPPFAPATFDHAYSIGVLHHTPDTRRAFGSVARLVRPGGGLAVYLYVRGLETRSSDLWRRLTTRLPLRAVYVLSAAAIPLHHLYRIPVLGTALQLGFPIAQWPDWRWRWLDTFDWYTPKYQWKHTWPEVHRWFREEGFGEIELFDFPLCLRGFRAAAAAAGPAGPQGPRP